MEQFRMGKKRHQSGLPKVGGIMCYVYGDIDAGTHGYAVHSVRI